MAFLICKVDSTGAINDSQYAHSVTWNMPTAAITRPRPLGFPLLFTKDWQLIEPVVEYLHKDVALRGATSKTIKTYAELLYDWFETLEQNGWDWARVTDEELAAYRDRMLRTPSPHTGRPYGVATINLRVRGVMRFYSWAHCNDYIESARFSEFGSVRGVADRSGRNPQDANSPQHGNKLVLTLRQYEQLPRPLTLAKARELLATLQPPYDLMARWQLYTGLRVGEVTSLTVQHILNCPEDDIAQIQVLRKGRRQGYVLAPRTLMDETRRYIDVWRRPKTREASRVPNVDPLFITPKGSPVTIDWYQRVVKRVGQDLGYSLTTHTLRATFACCMLVRLQRQASSGADVNPLMVVKILMGHSRIDTTDRYLRAVEIYKVDIDALLTGLLE